VIGEYIAWVFSTFIKPFHEEILAIATVIIAIYTIVLARVARRQTKDTRILQRAYLSVLPGGIHILNNQLIGVAHIEIHNGGNLPATRTKWFINHSLEGYGDWEIGEIDVRLTRTGDNTVSPKTTMRLGGPPITIGPDDLRHQDGLFLYVWGAASYRDGFGKRRFTRFCHRYNCVNFTQHPQLGGIAIDAVHARYHRLGNDAN
jgi:hypothetical protein